MIRLPSIFIFALFLLSRCNPNSAKETKSGTVEQLKYALGFKVTDFANYKIVEVTTPYRGAKAGHKYLLLQRGQEVPTHDPSTKVIVVPLETIVCTSTTHIPLLDYLEETDRLTGFPTTDYISSEKMRKRVDAGKIRDLGIDKSMNLELLITLHPSMVMGYTMTSDMGQLKKIQDIGIPVVINSEYLEKHPLGRAEWIKFMALFFNKEREADSIFNNIETEYLQTQTLIKKIASRPDVLSGIVYGDSWFLPGGQNYAARLFEDAGLNYLWKSDSSSSFLALSFESVFHKAKDADFWIGVGSFNSLSEIQAAEGRYSKFKPFMDGNVYTYNFRKGAKGGSEFLELGYLRPDLILKDLVKIGHPELLPQYQLYFHQKLK